MKTTTLRLTYIGGEQAGKEKLAKILGMPCMYGATKVEDSLELQLPNPLHKTSVISVLWNHGFRES